MPWNYFFGNKADFEVNNSKSGSTEQVGLNNKPTAVTTTAPTSVTNTLLCQPLLFQLLLFQGCQHGSKVPAHQQMQFSNASPFPEPCCGGWSREWRGLCAKLTKERAGKGLGVFPTFPLTLSPWPGCPAVPWEGREHPRESLLLLQGVDAGAAPARKCLDAAA